MRLAKGLDYIYPLLPGYIFPLLILAGGSAVYHNSFSGVFIYDDLRWIVDNPNLRTLWPPWEAAGNTLRPLLFYTLGLNRALSGLEVWSYHGGNLAIHLVAALTLYGVLRRSLLQINPQRYSHAASKLALAVALIWVAHPLQTQSVTYIIQRGEAMMGGFYLLTLYCVIRGASSPRQWAWYGAAMTAHLGGLTSKEVMVTAPLMIAIYDALVLAPSWTAALRQRWGLYLGLMAPGLLVGGWWLATNQARLLALFSGDSLSATWLEYALSQPGVVLYYLRLVFWPHPLCLDYGWPLAQTWGEILPALGCIAVLVLATIITLKRRQPWGLLGVWFLLILAPTSSVVPLQDLLVEHRMYLPLAAPITALVLAGYELLRYLPSSAWRTLLGTSLVGFILGTAGLLTIKRNAVYHSAYTIWQDVVAQYPHNPRGHNNLGNALVGRGYFDQALAHYQEALRLRPNYPEAHANLGGLWMSLGKLEEAAAAYSQALLNRADYPEAHNNLGIILGRQGQLQQAAHHYRQALRWRPNYADAYANWGVSQVAQGQLEAAYASFSRALELNPELAEAHNNQGSILVGWDRPQAALPHYRQAIQHKPTYLDAHINMGIALLALHRDQEAQQYLAQAVALDPLSPKAHNYLGAALYQLGKPDLASEHHNRALQLHPSYAGAHENLARILLDQDNLVSATKHLLQALRYRPGSATTHYDLGRALWAQGRTAEAQTHFRQALQLDPNHAEARNYLKPISSGGD